MIQIVGSRESGSLPGVGLDYCVSGIECRLSAVGYIECSECRVFVALYRVCYSGTSPLGNR